MVSRTTEQIKNRNVHVVYRTTEQVKTEMYMWCLELLNKLNTEMPI